jgi:hypothetical protein
MAGGGPRRPRWAWPVVVALELSLFLSAYLLLKAIDVSAQVDPPVRGLPAGALSRDGLSAYRWPGLASPEKNMMLMLPVVPALAIGYSLVYLLLGGGVGGAVIIFIVAKMLRR